MKFLPDWKGILIIFGALIIILLGNFFWQTHRINENFIVHSLEHSRIIGAVVELNIRNSLMNHSGMETIIASSLKNSARFINNLNQVEPFSTNELAAFAAESGLAGVSIILAESKGNVSGPERWLPVTYTPEINKLNFLPDNDLYIFSYSSEVSTVKPEFIIVGMSSEEAENIHNKTSVDNLLKMLRKMNGIEYVRFDISEGTPAKEPVLIRLNGRPVSETRIRIDEKELIVGLEADYFSGRMQTLKKELFVFLAILIIFGCLSSLWIYRLQQHRLEQARSFERKMGRQLEQASLGRAASTIIHEMRNPLNAINIGLQRLQIEASQLDNEHTSLLSSMCDAVERSNSVLANLQQYVKPLKVDFKNINPAELLQRLLILYKSQCNEKSIKFELSTDKSINIKGDENYLSQVLENLLKNGIEALSGGGIIKIIICKSKKDCIVLFENRCSSLSEEENKMVLEPYFTTKTYGTGLGLAISKKIIDLHHGTLQTGLQDAVFSVQIRLPFNSDKQVNNKC